MKKIVIITFFFLFLAIITPTLAQAAGLIPCGGEGEAPCGFCHFFVLIKGIIDFLMFRIVPPIAILLLVIGGAMFMFGGANPSMMSGGKNTLIAVVVGLILIYASWLIINLFFTAIGVASPAQFGIDLTNWWQINCQ